MWLTWIGTALAGKYDGLPTDIQAERLVAAPPEEAFNYLLDLKHVRSVYPDDCVGQWDIGERSFGEGANALVRYDMAMMHRKLPMTLVRATPTTAIDFDHVGPRGFVTRWLFAAQDAGTRVTLLTPLHGPPPPFLGYFHTRVKPEWEACYARTLENLEKALAAR